MKRGDGSYLSRTSWYNIPWKDASGRFVGAGVGRFRGGSDRRRRARPETGRRGRICGGGDPRRRAWPEGDRHGVATSGEEPVGGIEIRSGPLLAPLPGRFRQAMGRIDVHSVIVTAAFSIRTIHAKLNDMALYGFEANELILPCCHIIACHRPIVS
ncbi:uncharacterized protein [Lolium perenne]|uniref:uncharacterized protein isoform X1 n=1 Tax=Lolium perenne TaxID=4522 RepID=UPI003A99D6E9